MADADFEMCDRDEHFIPLSGASSSHQSGSNTHLGDQDMNAFRDAIANGLFVGESN